VAHILNKLLHINEKYMECIMEKYKNKKMIIAKEFFIELMSGVKRKIEDILPNKIKEV